MPIGQGAVYLYETGAPFSCKVPGSLAGGQLGWSLAEPGDLDKNRTSDVLFGQPEALVGAGSLFERAVLR